ncbi:MULTISPECIES: hypothetical protein [Sphingobacterium]|uniref:Uncharacterized protein n=1 Tax=Sphingobacterium athyrii TaxID=2152717 RepID=A0A363NZ30_9SPHI|nr:MULTISPECIES: hypothetical protein [Sphingobacterium]PUV25931.1 hypothetical protein DCO56_02865 [Sphingobacterium athyrii]QIH33198.1 hypothetical protein G6053_10035 [Sphingobacterium sp. DR205]
MKDKKKGNWLKNQYFDLKQTLIPIHPNDSSWKKFGKQTAFFMFLTLMACGAIAMLIAVSFAH